MYPKVDSMHWTCPEMSKDQIESMRKPWSDFSNTRSDCQNLIVQPVIPCLVLHRSLVVAKILQCSWAPSRGFCIDF